MEFDELLSEYECNLELVARHRKHGHKSPEYWDGYQAALLNNFHHQLLYLDFKPVITKPSQKENKEYALGEEKELPVRILHYRGYDTPIYFDDYGQQEFIVIDGKTYGGGAYNTLCEYDFCMIIDRIIDEQIANIKAER